MFIGKKSSDNQWRVNDKVLTPLGPGVVWGYTKLEGEERWRCLVRVQGVPGNPQDVRCRTPRATKSSLWAFWPEELEVRP